MPKQGRAAKPKRPQLTKEQLAQQAKDIGEANRFKTLIRESLFPVLQDAGNLFQAKMLCEVLSKVMLSKCNNYWADKTVLDLGLMEELTGDAEAKDVELYSGVIKALEPLSITDAQKLLQGMGGALDGYARAIAEKQMMKDLSVDEIINPVVKK